MYNVLMSGKSHRTRRIETMNNPPEGIRFVKQDIDVVKDHEANLKSVGRTALQKIYDFVRFNNLIPAKDLEGIDLIYSCGKVILNEFDWVLEIDNVACISYYNLGWLKALKGLIRARLRSDSCKRIICISEAGKKSIMNYFKDKKIEKKCIVIYPYVKKQEKKVRDDGVVKLLYVCSSGFYLKGGKELLKAFKKLRKVYPEIELTIVANFFPNENEDLTGITIVSPTMSKQRLYEDYYCTHDIFIQLSYQDSFGLATLEAVSCGLPVICTDMFALPEIVKHNYNGYVIKAPIDYFNNYLPNKRYWGVDLDKFARKHEFPKLQRSFEFYLEKLIKDKKLRERMSKNAHLKIDKCFNEVTRKKRLKEALV